VLNSGHKEEADNKNKIIKSRLIISKKKISWTSSMKKFNGIIGEM